jgi:trimeric autotransporter adhesin
MKAPFTILTLMLAATGLYAQGTAFTYQGRLNTGGTPANGTYDLVFTVFASASGLTDSFANQTNSATSVSNGLFTVTLNLGDPNIFTGEERWLEIEVRTNGPGGYVKLIPRQKITPTPYAITAGNVVSNGLAGTYANAVTFSNPANSFSGNGGGLANVNALTLGGVSANGFWRSAGNAGTTAGANFLGTTDNQALELQVNGTRALRIEPHGGSAPSLVGGYLQNGAVGYHGATVAGGGTSGSPNYAMGDYAFVGAGHGGQAADFSAVVGGAYNVSPGQLSFIGSGERNMNQANYSVIGGGSNNVIAPSGSNSFIGGGLRNSNLAPYAVVVGGVLNTAAGPGGAFVGGGGNNLASDYNSVVSGGANNRAVANATAVGGGSENTANNDHSTVGGGQANTASGPASTIAGGVNNISSGQYATVGGGLNNLSSDYATVGGGYGNTSSGNYATVDGGVANLSSGGFATVGGGYGNTSSNLYATVGGGQGNTTSGNSATVGGGYGNTSSGNYATVDGGIANLSSGGYATVGGGQGNTSSGFYATVGGGYGNSSSDFYATVGGGSNNRATNDWATVPGGDDNLAGGQYSFAAGHQAKALHSGAFVWADSAYADFVSSSPNQFLIRASGGVGIGTAAPNAMLHVAGPVQFGSGTGTAETPDKPIIFRRLKAMNPNIGNVVARTDKLTLERDGTPGGWRIVNVASPGPTTIAATGLTLAGATVNFVTTLAGAASAGTNTVFTSAQNVVSFRCTFGDSYGPGELTEATLTRYGSDYFWMGTVNSTFNQ